MDKTSILMILSMVICIIAVGVGFMSNDSWRGVAVTCSLLCVGLVLFIAALFTV